MTDALVEAVRIALTPHFSSAQRAYGDDREAARAALAAIAEQGFVIVPKEPTRTMIERGRWVSLTGDERTQRHQCASENCDGQPWWHFEAASIGSDYCRDCRVKVVDQQTAMLAARPKQEKSE